MNSLACSAGVLSSSGQFARESATSRSEEEMGRVKRSGEGAGREKRKYRAGVFFSPLPLPPFILSPSHLIFLCHKINDGGYNNITNTNNVSPTQNTPALQAMNSLDDNPYVTSKIRRGLLNKVSYGSNPLSFCIQLLTEKVPLSYTFH